MNATIPGGRLFCFGLGYSAKRLTRHLFLEDWPIAGTGRSAVSLAAIEAAGATAHRFDRDHPLEPEALGGTTHVLVSVPPDEAGDPVLDRERDAIVACAPDLTWIGYLSSTGVYGDTQGAFVDETSEPRPTSPRSERRAEAERAWLAFGRDRGVPVHVFRLAGIYGPGRSALDSVRNGTARRINAPGHRFSRIHVEDIARVLRASMAKPNPGAVYNVCDDEPAAPADVAAFAAEIMGYPEPPLVPLDEALATMSPMARSFWRDRRRVSNARIKRELGVRLRYPDYRAGLRAILGTGG